MNSVFLNLSISKLSEILLLGDGSHVLSFDLQFQQ